MSGYGDHFKKMKKNNSKEGATGRPQRNSKSRDQMIEEAFGTQIKKRPSRRGRVAFPILSLLVAGLGAATAYYGFTHLDQIDSWISKLEITAFGAAQAQSDSTNASAKSTPPKDEKAAELAASTKAEGKTECPEVKAFTQDELSHFNKLNDRKKELDLRESELNALEEELHKQKKEIEDRIVKLEQIRGEVANVLKERVEVDQQRVGTLVDFYSNMKPKQAADIFAKLNENLAVEVLSKMKKKNAADILNLLEPTKARALSEKFTGYQRQ